jgi:hypothetical protein
MNLAARALAQELVQLAGAQGLLRDDHLEHTQAVSMVAMALEHLPELDDWLLRPRADDALELHALSPAALHSAIVRRAAGDTSGLAVSMRARRLDDPRSVVRFDQSGLVADVGGGPGHVRHWTFDLGDGEVVTLRGELHVDGRPSAEERFAQALYRRVGPVEGRR